MSSTSKGAFELSAKRRALLEALLSEEGIKTPRAERILRREEGGPAPLSFAQRRLWFFDQFEPGNPAYNLVSTVSLRGKLDAVALERAFSEVTRRHEALRTTFDFRDGEPVQLVAPPQPLHSHVVDITHLPEAERDAVVRNLIHEQTQASFDLRRGPLLRITLVRLSDEEHVLLLAMHHIVSDAWSMGVLVGEVVALYEAYTGGRDALYDLAGGLQGLAISLHGTGRRDRRLADCQPPPPRVGRADRVFRQHASDAHRPLRQSDFQGATGTSPRDGPRCVRESGLAV